MAILQSVETYVFAGYRWRVCRVQPGKWVVYQFVNRTWDKFGKRRALYDISFTEVKS